MNKKRPRNSTPKTGPRKLTPKRLKAEREIKARVNKKLFGADDFPTDEEFMRV